MKIDKVRQVILKARSGKCVCPETLNPTESYQLVLKHLQNNNTHVAEVKVYDILHNETSKCMAFGFKLKDEDIFPFVTDGTELKYMRLPSTQKITEDTFNETFLFKWGKSAGNNWRSLKSVAQPNLYLFVEENVKLTINSVEMPEFKIEKVLKRSRNLNEPQKNVRTPRINQDSNQTLDSTKFWLRKRKTKKIKMSLKNKWSDSFEVL